MKNLTDDELIKLLTETYGYEFTLLNKGIWKDRYENFFIADCVFMDMLASKSNDRTQLIRIFRNSGLFDKILTKH